MRLPVCADWKRCPTWLAVALLFAAMPQQFFAATGLMLASTRGTPGLAASLPLFLRADTNIVAFQADVLFDPSMVSSGASAAGPIAANHVVVSSEFAPGLMRVLCYSLVSTSMINGVVARLDFTLKPGTSDHAVRLSLSNVVLVTAAPEVVPAINGNGLIVIDPVFIRIDGNVGFFLGAVPERTNVIQASTNLADWIDIGATVPQSPILEFTDTNAQAFPHRFYRAAVQP